MHLPYWPGRGRCPDPLDRAVQAYLSIPDPAYEDLDRSWAGAGSRRTASTLAALIKVDMHARFGRGERPRVLDYLDRFPSLVQVPDRIVSLVYEEFCLLEEQGERPDSAAFCDDYDRWRDSLRSQLAYHRELSRAVGLESGPVKFPDLGERFDKYRLNSILGEGGVARVYLATEEDLGGRQVAIKVSASFGQEPSILAKLNHRNIVPILTVAESDSGLRGICMPYRPGSTLEDLIRRIGRGRPPRSARSISEALRPPGMVPGTSSDENRDGWADFPAERTYPEAIAWIGLALAHALSYLHKQGVFHRDIKPANILLAHREGPQLLDFNLAQVPSNAAGASAAQKGGTLPYMAPEQLRAFLDPTAWDEVTASADLYSLGLVLRELLGGSPPDLPTSQGSLPREIQSLVDRRKMPRASIREVNPDVPPALESIVEKCLSFEPLGRYSAAEDLAEDLHRFLDRKPLKHAPNPSLVERTVNWAYRNRQAVAATFFLGAVVLWMSGTFSGDRSGDREFREAELLSDSNATDDLRKAKAAFQKLHRERPNTARSSLGLAMTLRKLEGPESKQAADLFREAASRTDAEQVLLDRLDRQPKSNVLLLNLGIVLAEKNQRGRAIEMLKRSIQLDPAGFMAMMLLANVYDHEGQPELSRRYQEMAIEIVKKAGRHEFVLECRLVQLHRVIKLIDARLEGPVAGSPRDLLLEHREFLDANIRALSREGGESEDLRVRQSYVHAFRGCSSSIGVALATGRGDSVEASKLVVQARDDFAKARTTLSDSGVPRDRIVRFVDEQERKLADRSGPSGHTP